MERLTHRRRGVLLLVVLSMLTLFMMLGATYLVLAARARATARAFAAATNGSSSLPSASQGQSFADDAFMRVVRGSMSGSAGIITNANTLLGDKYGTTPPQTGTIVSGSTSGSIIISMVVTGTAPAESLAGRVLTFTLPGLTNASVRILRAEPVISGSTARLAIPAGLTLSGENLTATAIANAAAAVTGATHFVINGREFSGSPDTGSSDPHEPYDAYDERNDYLANPLSPSTRPSFSVSGTTASSLAVDNDGDGALDSGWIDIGLPPVELPAGTVYPRAAILVTDLDGRLNLNAHGSRTTVDNPEAGSGTLYSGTFASGSNGLANITSATSSFTTIELWKYPRGLGVGPAEIALESLDVFESQGDGTGSLVLSGGSNAGNNSDSLTQRRPPKIGLAEGRYGGRPQMSATSFPRPGAPYVNDQTTALLQGWIAATGTDYFVNPVRFGSPPDLKARTRIFLDDYGQPVYYKPYWSTPSDRPATVDDETIDDPYEVNLSRLGPRLGASFNPIARSRQLLNSGSSADASSAGQPTIPDNLYSAGDLEGLLRLYDIDSPKLPRRLVALCGNKAGESRLLLTTDSWDSSAMTGAARAAVSQLLTVSSTATGMTPTTAMAMFAPETLMGHKLDLNRPFHNSSQAEPNGSLGQAQRLAFAKHFYALAFAIAGNGGALHGDPTTAAQHARQLAQWAINIVDFRDADSVMTGFEFDNDLTDGWNVNGDLAENDSDQDRDVVWGCERPELLITETVCWHDRNTDDLSTATNDKLTTDSTTETDFDQAYRPQGAFFFELFSPWESQAAEYDPSGIKAVRRTVGGGTSSLLRAEPIAPELLATEAIGSSSLGRFGKDTAINLSGTTTTPTGGFPVWRVVTFKNTTTGTTSDPLVATTGSAWRTFYFRAPPISLVRTPGNGDIVSGTSAVAYWPSVTAVSMLPKSPMVFGTGTSFTIGGNVLNTTVASSFIPINQLFLATTGTESATTASCTATLTEPQIIAGTNASYDPYAVLKTQTLPPTTVAWPLTGNNTNDRPLDDLDYPAAGITQLFGPSGDKTLFQNGRHSNYFTAHLQRLANPKADWDPRTNPYVTIDSQPVDLHVFNTLSLLTSAADAGKNYDEPCGVGSPFSSLITRQRKYDDADTGTTGTDANINIERGKTESTATNDFDIWSARINPAGAGNLKLLSRSGSIRDAKQILGSGNSKSLDAVPVPSRSGTTSHSLGRLSPRFVGSGTGPTKPFPWLVWNNRPFVSAAELSLVPKTSAFELLRQHCTAECDSADVPPGGRFGHLPGLFEPVTTVSSTSTLLAPWVAITGRSGSTGEPTKSTPSIWDAVHVPTPFGGSYQDVPVTSSGTAALAPLGLDHRPYGQLPHFREPGRINVNTITGTSVWNALVGTGTAGTTIRTWSGTSAPFTTPAATLPEALALLSGTTRFIDTYASPARRSDANSFFRYQTVNRLTNLVTVRSNVFAVWITIGYSSTSSGFTEAGHDTGDIRRHRAFFIYDRSIPVGFDPGKDLNVRDAILLRRIAQ
jgi:hypothetical protein